MALDTHAAEVSYNAEKKDLYEMGEVPPMGHVPSQMYAWTIRRERHGEPDKAFAGRGRRHARTGQQRSAGSGDGRRR